MGNARQPTNGYLPIVHLTWGGFHLSQKGSCSAIQGTLDAKKGHAFCSVTMPMAAVNKGALWQTYRSQWISGLRRRGRLYLSDSNRETGFCLTRGNQMKVVQHSLLDREEEGVKSPCSLGIWGVWKTVVSGEAYIKLSTSTSKQAWRQSLRKLRYIQFKEFII